MLIRAILPDWAREKNPKLKKVIEGEYDEGQIANLNQQDYNVYYFPNYPSEFQAGTNVDGTKIATFSWIFVDYDHKEGTYESFEDFLETVYQDGNPSPTKIVYSGNGVHAYWKIIDLDALSYVKLQRRLCRYLTTDPAVGKICQLMRLPNTANTKDENDFKVCEIKIEEDYEYSCEEMDKWLPKLSEEDEIVCKNHFDQTYRIESEIKVEMKLPLKFGKLMKENPEAKKLYTISSDDRSAADYRLGHIMFASGFTKKEAMSVLVNVPKAAERSPKHRVSYAENIIEKIWTYELEGEDTNLSSSVREILSRGESKSRGVRLPCSPLVDDTERGFRRGQVQGLVAGSGVGKTTFGLNEITWFAERNPDCDHFIVTLEQPDIELAERVQILCKENPNLQGKIHILGNYGPNGEFRHLSLDDIKDYLMKWKEENKKDIGVVIIDHIGALKKQSKNGENQAIVDICHRMKSFAVETDTFLIMQSQAPREKAGIGDLELDKDAAYGTVFFESYVDYLICMWQPLKRAYISGAPIVVAFKFAKIRHKQQNRDNIKEDVCYQLIYEPETERLRELTQAEEVKAKFFLNEATSARKRDKKSDLIPYVSRRLNGTAENPQNAEGTESTQTIRQ